MPSLLLSPASGSPSNVLPQTPIDNALNGGFADLKHSSEFVASVESSGMKFSDLKDCFTGEFSGSIFLSNVISAVNSTITLIGLCGVPFEIIQSIVMGDAVQMPAHHFVRTRPDECKQDETMNEFRAGFLTYSNWIDETVSVLIGCFFENFPFSHSWESTDHYQSCKRFDSTLIRDTVSGESRNVSPKFTRTVSVDLNTLVEDGFHRITGHDLAPTSRIVRTERGSQLLSQSI